MKKLSQAIALAGVMATGVAGSQFARAEVEVAASAAVANMYLWRGQDLGIKGVPAVSGDLSVSTSGAYGGVWASSGDASSGQEYDLYLGYGGEEGDFSYDVSAWTYVYPAKTETRNNKTTDAKGNTFELSELIVSLGFAGASFSYYHTLSSNPSKYSYMTLGYGMDKFSATLGRASSDADKDDYTHLDLGYAYNDQISFTLSKVVAQKANPDKGEEAQDEDLKVVVSYSLPIKL